MLLLKPSQSVIDWFENIIHKNRWDDSAIEEMRERVQQTIDSQYLDSECLDCIGETAWDDWTDCKDQEISTSRS